jgi:hypothetical protein
MRGSPGEDEVRRLAASLSDSEDVGVRGAVPFTAGGCRDRSSDADILGGLGDGLVDEEGEERGFCYILVRSRDGFKGFKVCGTRAQTFMRYYGILFTLVQYPAVAVDRS